MIFRKLPLLLAVVLSACSADEDTARYLLRPVADDTRIRPSVTSVEVREVSLPGYAANPEVMFQTPDGALRSSTLELWADDPTRGVTFALVRDIGKITGVTVASEPWPLIDFPDVRLEVRITDMFAGEDGFYRLAGQYFVTAIESRRSDRVRNFDISTMIEGEGYPAIAAAASAALHQLSLQIAREGLSR